MSKVALVIEYRWDYGPEEVYVFEDEDINVAWDKARAYSERLAVLAEDEARSRFCATILDVSKVTED